jgi:hypothetical protein
MGLKSNRKKPNKYEIKKKSKLSKKNREKWLGLNFSSRSEIKKTNQ